MNALSREIPDGERLITIEDAAELQMQQPHVIRLETRTMSAEGTGQVTMRDLLVNTLRMRPDRIIVGEVRGGEAQEMLQAMNTGHPGSMCTLHANNPARCADPAGEHADVGERGHPAAGAAAPDRRQHRPGGAVGAAAHGGTAA